MNPTIGFIGVGLMGHGMAKNIVTKGWPLVVMGHRNREPVDHLVSLGAREAGSARELGRSCDIVHLCVTGSPQVEALVRGGEGLLASPKPGLVIIDCSTSNPVSTLALADECRARGVSFVDAPLSRSPRRPRPARWTRWSAPTPRPSRASSRCCAAGPGTSCTSARSGSGTR